MADLLPPELKIKVSARPMNLSDTTLERADAAVVVLERAADTAAATAAAHAALGALPHAQLWQRLHRAAVKAGQETPILAARLATWTLAAAPTIRC